MKLKNPSDGNSNKLTFDSLRSLLFRSSGNRSKSHSSKHTKTSASNIRFTSKHLDILHSVLSDMLLFRSLGAFMISMITSQITVMMYSDKQEIGSGMRSEDQLMIVVHGSVAVHETSGGPQVAILPCRSFIGPVAPFHSIAIPCSYSAVGDTIICVLTAEALKGAMAEDTAVYSVMASAAHEQFEIYQLLQKSAQMTASQKMPKIVVERKAEILQKLNEMITVVPLERQQMLTDGPTDNDILHFIEMGAVELSSNGRKLAIVHPASFRDELNRFGKAYEGALSIRCISPRARVLKLRYLSIAEFVELGVDNPHLLEYFISQVIAEHQAGINVSSFFSSRLSLSTTDSVGKLLENSPTTLCRNPTILSYLCSNADFIALGQNDYVFKSGYYAESCFVVAYGLVEVFISADTVIGTIGPGQHFGEVGMIWKQRRFSNARVTSESALLLEISYSVFRETLSTFPEIEHEILSAAREELNLFNSLHTAAISNREEVKRCLYNIKQLKSLSKDVKDLMTDLVTMQRYGSNEVIYHEKYNKGPVIYYVMRGTVSTYDAFGELKRTVNQGESFGHTEGDDLYDHFKYVVENCSSASMLCFNQAALKLLEDEAPILFDSLTRFCRVKSDLPLILQKAFKLGADNANHLVKHVIYLRYREGDSLTIPKSNKSKLLYVLKGSLKQKILNSVLGTMVMYESEDIFRVADDVDVILYFNHDTVLLEFDSFSSTYIQESRPDIEKPVFPMAEFSKLADSNIFPRNVYRLLFDHLTREDQRKFRLVNSHWDALLREKLPLTSIIMNKGSLDFDRLAFFCSAGRQHIRTCDFSRSAINMTVLNFIALNCQFITNLNLEYCKKLPMSSGSDEFVFSSFRHLKEVRLFYATISEAVASSVVCRNLQILHVRRLYINDPEYFERFLGEFVELVEIAVRDINKGDFDRFFQVVAQKCPYLETLCLDHACKSDTPQGRVGMTDIAMRYIAGGVTRLHTLKLRFASHLTDAGLYELSLGPQAWRTIELMAAVQITDTSVFYFSNGFRNMKSINLSHCPRITRAAVQYLVVTCTQIEVMQFHSCRMISPMDDDDIPEHIQFVTSEPFTSPSRLKGAEIPLGSRYNSVQRSVKLSDEDVDAD